MKGDEAAFRQIAEEYRPLLLWYVRGMVRDRELTEEVVQEVFLSVYQHLPRFSEDCLFTTWLYRLARNKALDALRSAQSRPKIDRSYALESIECAQTSNAEDGKFVAAIWRAVAELDEGLRRPLLLRDVTGLSYREIGETLEIPMGTVKWRIHRARELVQEALARDGLTRTATLAGDVSVEADDAAASGATEAC